MGRLSTVSFWLLMCCLWSNGTAEDDMADIKKGISQIITKLSVIENRLTKLEELPREVHNVKVLMTSMIQKSKAYHGNGTSEKHVNGHKQLVSGEHPAKPAGVNVKVNSDHEPKSTKKKFKIVDPTDPVTADDRAKSSLILASAKKVFLSNFLTKTWKEIPMTPHPDSLLYDDVHRRLYWVTKKPGAVGFFTGKDWKSQDFYRTNDGVLRGFALDDQAEVEVFVIKENLMKLDVILRKKGKSIKQLQLRPLRTAQSYVMAVNASTKTVLIATFHHHVLFIASCSYAQQRLRAHFVPAEISQMRITAVTFDKHSSSIIYSACKSLFHKKLDGRKRNGHTPLSLFGRRSHLKPDVICPEEIQIITSCKDHFYAFGKKNVYTYNRKFQLVETLLLPDLKGDRMKTAAAVNMEG